MKSNLLIQPRRLAVARLGSVSLAWLLIATAASLRAAEFPPEWRHVQTVSVNQRGWLRFDLPLETLSALRPGLEDLRIYDDAGREVPYIVERPVQRASGNQRPAKFTATVRADATIALIETGISQALSSLTLQTPARQFLKSARLEGSLNGEDWKLLGEGLPLFVQSTGASQLRVEFAGATWPFLRLTLDDRRSAPIPVTGALLHARAATAPSSPLPAEIISRVEGDGETRLELRLAAANATLAGVTLLASDPVFSRQVKLVQPGVTEGEVRETPVAAGSIYRLVLEERPAFSNTTFAVDVPVRSREVTLTIRNDDSAPLDISGVRIARRPLFLTLNAVETGSLHLLSGNSTCQAPRYDLARLQGELRGATEVIPVASPLLANAAFRTPDPLATLAVSGAPLDVSAWGFRKLVRVAQAGIQQLELDLEVLARASPTFADLRLLAADKQVPYLIERSTTSRSIALMAKPADDPKRPRTSRWSLSLPHKRLPLTRLTCETKVLLFRREAIVFEEVPDSRGDKHKVVLGQASWVRTPEQKSGKLTMTLNHSPATDQLWVEVENGDNPPLELGSFMAWYPTARLFFKSPEKESIALYYGNIQASPPRYDLDLVAARIVSAEKAKAALAAEEPLRKPTLGESLSGGRGQWIFWAVLGIVVVGLLAVLARLLPKTQEK
jgi:hypothetical protein